MLPEKTKRLQSAPSAIYWQTIGIIKSRNEVRAGSSRHNYKNAPSVPGLWFESEHVCTYGFFMIYVDTYFYHLLGDQENIVSSICCMEIKISIFRRSSHSLWWNEARISPYNVTYDTHARSDSSCWTCHNTQNTSPYWGHKINWTTGWYKPKRRTVPYVTKNKVANCMACCSGPSAEWKCSHFLRQKKKRCIC